MLSPILARFPALDPFVASEWRAHVADDFKALAATPSSGIVAYCHAFRADPAFYTLETLLAFARGTLDDATRARFVEGWQAARNAHPPIFIPLHKAVLKEGLRTATDPAVRAQVEATLARLADVEMPKAAAIRAAMKPILARQLGSALKSHGGGDWIATFALAGKPMALHVDTGGMGGGFRYGVHASEAGRLAPHPGVSYEMALGLPAFKFDLLRSDCFDEQMAQWDTRLARLLAALAGQDVA